MTAPAISRRRPSPTSHPSAGPAPVKASVPGVAADLPATGAPVGAVEEAGPDEADTGAGVPGVAVVPAGEVPAGVVPAGVVPGDVVVVVVVVPVTVTTKKPVTSLPVTWPGPGSLTNV